MSHPAINVAGYSSSSYNSATGISSAAGFVETNFQKIAKAQSGTGLSQVSMVKTLESLEQYKADCSLPNWGGDDETAVDPLAVENAAKFLKLLPAKFHRPDVVPEADGAIALEWRFGAFRSLIVSFTNSPQIEYSLLTGRLSADFGRRQFFGLVPLEIVRNLNRISN